MLQNPLVTQLSLYDIAGTPGVACDLSHINSKAQTKVSGLGLVCGRRGGSCGVVEPLIIIRVNDHPSPETVRGWPRSCRESRCTRYA